MTDRTDDAGTAFRLVPDTDELHVLGQQAEDVLLWLRNSEQDIDSDPDSNPGPDAERWLLPEPIADGRADDAFGRVLDELREHLDVVQHPLPDAGTGRPRLLAPDGRYEHLPLRAVPLDQADLHLLAGAVAVINQALSLDAGKRETDPDQSRKLDDLLDLLSSMEPDPVLWETAPQALTSRRLTASELLRPLARLVAVLDLAPDEDTRMLTAALRANPEHDLVLTASQERAYQRVASRINLLLADADPVSRYLY